jgi:hypothetical protein
MLRSPCPIDEPHADFERGGYRALGICVRELTDADAERWDRVLVVESHVGNRCRRGHVTCSVMLNVDREHRSGFTDLNEDITGYLRPANPVRRLWCGQTVDPLAEVN